MKELKPAGGTAGGYAAHANRLIAADAAPSLAPAIDWVAARTFLALTRGSAGIDDAPPVLTLFGAGAAIHLPGDLGPDHRRRVEAAIARHPGHALGVVVNPAGPCPAAWGSAPGEQRSDGAPRTWGAADAHVAGAVGIWAECDGGLPREAQERIAEQAGLPRPSLTVWTGGRSLHLYWLIAGGEELLAPARFRALQRHLANAIDAAVPGSAPDKAVSNPARVMRLPGGRHARTGERCVIADAGGPRYTAAQLDGMFPDPAPAALPIVLSGAAPTTSGSWFARLTPQLQRERAVEMLRCLPLRTKAGQGLYEPSLKCLAGIVHHFGAETAVALCEQAGWCSDAWNPRTKAKGLERAGAAGIEVLINQARAHGWRHPLDCDPNPTAPPPPGGVSDAGTTPRAMPSFSERWAALEAAADQLVRTPHTAARLAAELAEAAADAGLQRLTRRDLDALLDAATRRSRPTAEPIAAGGRFRVAEHLWVADGLVRHGLNLLVGASGAGKTRLALSLAAAWLDGAAAWLDCALTGPPSLTDRHLLILGSDQGLSDWSVAMEPLGLVRDMGSGDRQLHPRVTLIPMESGVTLDADGLAAVRRWCDDHPGGMVVADSLAQLLPPGIDEDKSGAARPVHALADALGPSCWGLLLHHARKASGRERNVGVGAGRGSGAIDAAVSRVLGLALIHRMQDGQLVAQESDPRRELVSVKRGGPAVHLIVSSDGTGAWVNQGGADALRAEERRERAMANLTDLQQAALDALLEARGHVTTRGVWETQGGDWEADRASGGKGAALLRKTLRRLETIGLVESTLAGNERTYRAAAIQVHSVSPPQAAATAEPDAAPQAAATADRSRTS